MIHIFEDHLTANLQNGLFLSRSTVKGTTPPPPLTRKAVIPFSLENGFLQNFIWGLSTPVMSKAFFFQCKCAFKSIICVANNTKNANRIFIAKRQCLFFTKNLSKVGDLQLNKAQHDQHTLVEKINSTNHHYHEIRILMNITKDHDVINKTYSRRSCFSVLNHLESISLCYLYFLQKWSSSWYSLRFQMKVDDFVQSNGKS